MRCRFSLTRGGGLEQTACCCDGSFRLDWAATVGDSDRALAASARNFALNAAVDLGNAANLAGWQYHARR